MLLMNKILIEEATVKNRIFSIANLTFLLCFFFKILPLPGFAAFCYILAFILLLTASIYISPLLVGSANEKKMIRAPQEIDTGNA